MLQISYFVKTKTPKKKENLPKSNTIAYNMKGCFKILFYFEYFEIFQMWLNTLKKMITT